MIKIYKLFRIAAYKGIFNIHLEVLIPLMAKEPEVVTLATRGTHQVLYHLIEPSYFNLTAIPNNYQ